MDGNPEKRTDIYFKRSGTFERQDAILDGRSWRYNRREITWTSSDRNKELIRAFQRYLFAKGSKQYRVGKLTQNLRLICDFIVKDLDSLTKSDAEGFLAKVNRKEDWSPHTKRDYVRNFKQFFLWFEEEDLRLTNGDEKGRQEARRFYQYVRKISTAHPRHTLDYATIIRDDEAHILVRQGCQNSMERALVAFLHESGCRVGELLGVRIRDMERKGHYGLVRVDGKTGERRIPILQCIPHIEMWLRDHPARENPNALLWVSTHNGHSGEPLRHLGVIKLLKRVMERSGLKKRCNPHWFRHSRATILAPKYGEQVLCRIMGWELGSKQVRTYVHLGAQQVEEAFLKNHGLAEPESPAQKAQFCVCGATNEPEARYCFRCGNPLSVGVMLEDEGKKKAAITEALEAMLKDPEIQSKVLARFGGAR